MTDVRTFSMGSAMTDEVGRGRSPFGGGGGDTVRRGGSSSNDNSNINTNSSGGGSGGGGEGASVPPVLNEDKAVFARRRFLETLLGGMRLWLPTAPPASIRAFQIGLFVTLMLVGIVLSIVLGGSSVWLAGGVAGAVMALAVVCMQLLSWWLGRNDVTSVAGIDIVNFGAEDGDVEFDGFATAETAQFLLPSKSHSMTAAAAAAAFAGAAGVMVIVHPATVAGGSLASMSGANWVGLIWSWLVAALGLYSAIAAPPPELARYNLGDGGHLSTTACVTRPLQMAALASPAIAAAIIREASTAATPAGLAAAMTVCSVLLWCLPLLWAAGVAPPIRAGLEAALELAAGELVAVPATASTARMLLHIGVTAIIAVATWVLASAVSPAMGTAAATVLVYLAARTVLAQEWTAATCKRSPRARHVVNKRRVIPVGTSRLANTHSNSASSSVSVAQQAGAKSGTAPQSDLLFSRSGHVTLTDGRDTRADVKHSKTAKEVAVAVHQTPGAVSVAAPRVGETSWLRGLRWQDAVYLLGVAGTSVALAIVAPDGCVTLGGDACSGLTNFVGLGAAGVAAVAWAAAALQQPFLCCGMRNAMWSHRSAQEAPDAAVLVSGAAMGIVYRIAGFVATLAALAWLQLALPPTTTAAGAAWIAIASVRLAQRTQYSRLSAASEVGTLALLELVLDAGGGWRTLPLWARAIIVGGVARRLPDVWWKLKFMAVHLATSRSRKKLRYKGSKCVLIATFVLWPLVLASVLLSALMFTPLVPILGLPIFLPAFPRPRRQWRRLSVSSNPGTTDAAMYCQLVPEIANAMQPLVARGAFGEVAVGMTLLLRLEALIAVVRVVEVGVGRLVVTVSGLEQQEQTSCHQVEGNKLDAVLNQINKDESNNLKGRNAHRSHTLVPSTVMSVQAYTTSSMQLDAYFGMPDVLNAIDGLFMRALVLLLHEHVVERYGAVPDDWRQCRDLSSQDMEVAAARFPPRWFDYLEGRAIASGGASLSGGTGGRASNASRASSTNSGEPYQTGDMHLSDVESTLTGGYDSRRQSANEQPSPAPAPLMSHPVTSQDSGATSDGVAESVASALRDARGRTDDLDDLLAFLDDDDDQPIAISPKPAARSRPQQQQQRQQQQPQHAQRTSGHRSTLVRNTGAVDGIGLGGTGGGSRGAGAGAGAGAGQARSSAGSRLRGSTAGVGDAHGPRGHFRQMVNTAYAVIQVAGLGCHNGDAEASGGAHVVQVFGGEVPPSLGSEWLAERPVLGQVVMEAYRLAVGAGLEAANNFECDEVLEALENSKEKDMAELVDTLQRFRTEWFMGLETSAGWARAMGEQRGHLLSVKRVTTNEGAREIRGDFVSLQRRAAFVGRLNHEALTGFWAAMSQEMLYFTNDDEERYSIQAHDLLLRNLSIQAAQAPLGYPVWNSGPVQLRYSPL